MALFFNLEKIQKHSGKDIFKFLALLEYHWNRKPPPKRFKINLLESYPGNNYLLNPGPLFISNVDALYKIQYIKLAARRDWFMFKTYGVKTLDLKYYPDIDLTKINHNPLLQITNNTIKFKFEEFYNGIRL